MLIVVQMGSTNLGILLLTPRRFCAESRVTGRVAALLLVNSAMSTAGIMRLSTCMGLRPFASSNSGNTIKNWMKL